MVKPMNHHYSMENPATVYDEESLTVLQLVGRTTAKINECVENVNRVETNTAQELNRFEEQVIPIRVKEAVEENIEDGAFTESLHAFNAETEGKIANVEQRLNNVILESGDSTPEIVDMRVSAYNETYATAGESVRDQFKVLARAKENEFRFRDGDLTEGYYSTTNGGRGTSTEYYRSRFLVPFSGGKLVSVSTGNPIYLNFTQTISIVCYNKNFGYLGYVNGLIGSQPQTPKCTPSETAYIGINVPVALYKINDLTVKALDPSAVSYIDPNGYTINPGYVVYKNYYVNAEGNPASSENFNAVIFPVSGVKQIYSSAQVETSGIFYDFNGRVISNVQYEDGRPNGRLYTVPPTARYCALNFPYAKNANNEKLTPIHQYATFVYENGVSSLNGKRVLVIGDSLSWLDGQYNYGDGHPMIGWQTELRKRGAIVDTIAVSGACLAQDPTGTEVSLYQKMMRYQLVPDLYPEYAYRGYDAYVIFAGTNDIRVGVESQDFVTAFESMVNDLLFDAENTPAQIFFCNPLYSKSASRPMTKLLEYRGEMETACSYVGASFIDLLRNSGFNKKTLDELSYDGTHPNTAGMEKLGRVIANHMEVCL